MRIRWVKVWVDAMATLTERFRDEEGRVDFEALGREEYAFRHALVTGDFSRSERARDLYEATLSEITARSEAGRKSAEVRRNKKNTAAAATREGADVEYNRESGALERTTGCNHYDQETAKTTISTNSPAGAGVNLDSTQTNKRPDASDGNAEGVTFNGSPITRNGSRATRTSATSGQTIDTSETLDKAGAGEATPESVSAKPSPALPVISFGEFGNIKMTKIQYAKLCERFSIADSVLAEADQYFEAQPAKKKKYKNHYAMLLNWCKRRETEAKPKQGYKNINDINRENCEQIERDLRAMFHPEEVI